MIESLDAKDLLGVDGPASPSQPSAPAHTVAWSWRQRLAYRASLLFFGPIAVVELVQFAPLLDRISSAWTSLQQLVGDWIIANLLRLPPDNPAALPGNEPLQPLLFAIAWALVALLVATIWTLLGRRSAAMERGHAWLEALVRFALAGVMFSYGWGKVFPSQFGDGVRIYELTRPVGTMAPGTLLWTFMGASRPYAIMGGVLELTGGILLLSRRTQTLGGLILIVVLVNVFALNVMYHVNVKVYSFLLLLMAVFVVASDARRLRQFFLGEGRVEPRSLAPFFGLAPLDRIARIGGLVLALFLFFQTGNQTLQTHRRYHFPDDAPIPALYGLYEVAEFRRSNPAGPSVDSRRWVEVAFTSDRTVAWIEFSDSVDVPYLITLNEAQQSLLLVQPSHREDEMTLTYDKPDSINVILQGTAQQDSLYVRLRRLDLDSFRLITHQDRWWW
jgi:hypothetical protein